ncbi:MAG: CoA pyrophosphatase [Deltaproteobacteria bacterium]|nr:CoA pyrophosphatase [Deltaproteobacteria bacterium]
MSVDKCIEILRSRVPQLIEGECLKPAAVLVPIQKFVEGDSLVLTQRTDILSSHKGQVAFPGGRIDPHDSGALAAALRESHEEIGIEPRDVQILGQLDQVTAGFNYLVTPFVGIIPSPYEFRLNPMETAAVFNVPISVLLEPGCLSCESRLSPAHRQGEPIYHFRYNGWDIWGATARIIKQLLELVYGFEA